MTRTGWKGFGIVAAASAVLLSSAIADAQPKGSLVDAGKAPPRLVQPKIDVHAAPPAWSPATINRVAAAAVDQVVAAMRRFAEQVPAASVAPPAARPQVAPASVKTGRAQPIKSAVVEAKPVVIDQPVTGIDDHGLRGEVPGIQIRMPWRIP